MRGRCLGCVMWKCLDGRFEPVCSTRSLINFKYSSTTMSTIENKIIHVLRNRYKRACANRTLILFFVSQVSELFLVSVPGLTACTKGIFWDSPSFGTKRRAIPRILPGLCVAGFRSGSDLHYSFHFSNGFELSATIFVCCL